MADLKQVASSAAVQCRATEGGGLLPIIESYVQLADTLMFLCCCTHLIITR
jgi:hypothetical protein